MRSKNSKVFKVGFKLKFMKILKQSLLALILSCPALLSAQTLVTGKVTDGATNTTLSGVEIINETSGDIVVTDEEGSFTMEANQGDVIVVTYFGFNEQEFTYNGEGQLNFSLAKSTSQLDEVVIIGYGTARKEDVTGAVNKIGEDDFNKSSITSAQELITGKIAGVVVTSAGGAPGDGQNIIIRGNSSLALNSQPLYVVDGIPLSDKNIAGSRNPLDFLNPNDIESMTILKDASATAIYGSRAANGVVLITTKKGKGVGFKYNYNATTSIYTPTDFVDLMNAREFTALINEVGTAADIAMLGNADTNWQELIFKNAVGFDHNFSAVGRIGDFMPARFSLSNTNKDGILQGDNINRTTLSVNLSPSFMDDHLKFELNARGSYIENEFANRDAIGNAIEYDPTQPVYSGASVYGGYHSFYTPDGLKHNLAPTNPMALINEVDDTSEARRFVGNAKVDYKFHFFPALTATVNAGYDITNTNGRKITSALLPNSSQTWDGANYLYGQEYTNKLLDAYLTYNEEFGASKINAVVGYGYQFFDFKEDEFDSEKLEQGLEPVGINLWQHSLISYFGRVNYNYDNRYILTATLRADASSKLHPDNRWGYFPSAALAWNISNEDFLRGSDVISDLKLRVGYGEVGNVNGLTDYNFITRYSVSKTNAMYQFGDLFYSTYRPDGLNEDLKWEISNTLNFGLDYALFNNRIFGTLDIYHKKTKDLIANVYTDPFTNFTNVIPRNIGDMENKGIEFSINATPVKTQDVEWTVGYNIAYNDNKIVNLTNDNRVGDINGGTGNKIQIHKEGYAPYSFNVYKQIYDQNGRAIEGAYEDLNGDGVINESDLYIHESPYADVTMGLFTNIRYKNWDLSASGRVSLGNYAYNNIASSVGYERKATGNGQGYLSNVHRDYYNTGFVSITNENLLSDHFIEDASFFRIDNITLGYNINQAIKGMDVRLYGAVNNVAVFSNYSGIDPEMFGGIDNRFYLRPRTFVFGLNVNF